MSKNTFKQGARYRFRDQVFWAEGGLICIEDQRDGNFKVITRAEAAARAIALNEELKYTEYASERDELCRCVVNMCESVKEAKRQGDPTDPEVRRHLIKDQRKISVLMGPGPSSVDVLGSGTSIACTPKPTGFEVSDRFRNLRI